MKTTWLIVLKEVALLSHVRDEIYDWDLSPGPTPRQAHAVWVKSESYNLGTEDKHFTTREWAARKSDNL